MEESEAKVLEQLVKKFPDRTIYREQYTLKEVGATLFKIHTCAKAQGVSRIDWLTTKGFTWKETGYIEPDMKPEKAIRPEGEDPFDLADYIFRRYPLVGDYIPYNEESKLLYDSAVRTVRRFLADNPTTVRERAVLVLETIQLLKDWSTDSESDQRFWYYIFSHYGFKPDNSENAANRLLKRFYDSIKEVFRHYGRFFAPVDGHKYYNTLLLHALAPRQSIYGLFNILLGFFDRNLDYRYIPEDISYKVFTKGMRARWDSSRMDERIQLRSDFIFSGLQILFKERPGYMAVLADSLVKKMDALLRGQTGDLLDTQHSYWDRLLWNWYQEKSTRERLRVSGERQRQETEYVAVSPDRIIIKYAIRQEQVGLLIPRIRLPESLEQRPVLRLFHGGTSIYEDELSVTGDELCQTTRSRFILLSETDYDFSQPPDIRAEIQYWSGDKMEVLYQSGQKLQRSYIQFDSAGNEDSSPKGTALLFVGDSQAVHFHIDSQVYRYPHPGQLYRINMEQVVSVAVDGVEILVDEKSSHQFRPYTSEFPEANVQLVSQGEIFEIFPAKFSLTLALPEGDRAVGYRFSKDGSPLPKFPADAVRIKIPCPEEDGILHRVRLMDEDYDWVRYEYRYTILPDFRIELDKHLYRPGVDDVSARVSWRGANFDFMFRAQDEDANLVTVPGLPGQFQLSVPLIRCVFLGKNAFEIPKHIWYKNITGGETVKLELPSGWQGQLMLGKEAIPSSREGFELGNFLRAAALKDDQADIWLLLKNKKGHIIRHKITTVQLKPGLAYAPLEAWEGQLLWYAQDNFMGDPGSRFTILCTGPDGKNRTWSAGDEDEFLTDISALPEGFYTYRVVMEKRRVFAAGTSEEVYSGSFTLGHPHAIRYNGKELFLGNATCWDWEKETLKTVSMRYGCGILTGLSYQGMSAAYDGMAPAPCYSATLWFMAHDGRRHQFNSNPSRENEFDLVNPVKVWIVNEHILIVYTVNEGSLLVDKQYLPPSIVNRITPAEKRQYNRFEIPDYFEYTEEASPYV